MSKYKAVRTNGYASKKEASTAATLQLLAKVGNITDYREQVPFILVPGRGKERAITYVADFVYREDGREVVADVKGFRTPVYALKKRMMSLLLGIQILEL